MTVLGLHFLYDHAFIPKLYVSPTYLLVYREKEISRNAVADSKRGKEREEERGGAHVRGGGGFGATAERSVEKKSQRGSRLPTLKHHLKLNP